MLDPSLDTTSERRSSNHNRHNTWNFLSVISVKSAESEDVFYRNVRVQRMSISVWFTELNKGMLKKRFHTS